MLRFPKGTKEYIRAPVKDATAQLTTLDSAGTRYDIVEDATGTKKVDNALGTNMGMVALCMLDTTTGTWPSGKYKLYIRFNTAPEIPMLGPYEFLISDD